MDRKEAIKVLKGDFTEVTLPDGKSHSDLFSEAFNMAIAALQEPEIIRCKDCKHWYKEIMYCTYTGIQIEPNGYCVYGEVE